MKPKINWKKQYKDFGKKIYQKNKDKIKVERDKPENKLKQKLYMQAYNKRPEVILMKEEKDTFENKENLRLYNKKIYQKNKDKIKIERDKPENKLKLKLYMKEWCEKNKGYMKEYRNKPENKAREKARHQTSEYKAKIKERNQRPENKAKMKKWQEENKAHMKEYRNKPENKSIMKAYSKNHYQNNKDKIKIERDKPENKLKHKLYMKKWLEENKTHMQDYRNRPENKAKMKNHSRKINLKKFYNLSIEDYNKMVEQQNNKCALCGNEETNTFKGKIVNLSVDHNQKTGKVRELLCKNCNVSLGNLKEDISLFYKCIKYLKQDQEEKVKYINLKKDGIIITYTLTKEEYNKRAEQQNHKCAICGNEENGKKLSLDHNWKTGKIRSLLCKDCNVTLGNLKEDISLFYKCIRYLNKHKE